MGIFDVFLKSSDGDLLKENSIIDWNALTTVEQIEVVKQESDSQTLGIFKHSIRCGISSRILKRFSKSFPSQVNIKMYYLDLIAYREVSNKVSQEFQVVHQSPQLLIIKNRKTIENASHYDILNIDLQLFSK